MARQTLILALAAAVTLGCGSSAQKSNDGGSGDGSPTMCTYANGAGVPDGGAFHGTCPAAGCPAGTVCVTEVGGVAGGGGEYCAPIPDECHGTPTCACIATCACTNTPGGRPETCNVQNGTIYCDNGIR